MGPPFLGYRVRGDAFFLRAEIPQHGAFGPQMVLVRIISRRLGVAAGRPMLAHRNIRASAVTLSRQGRSLIWSQIIVLKQIRLVKFRAFKDFTVSFREGTYMVGPNNAGKSTILTSLRIADVLLRHSYRRKPDLRETDKGLAVTGYPVNLREFPALRDSLRFEFGDEEARLEVQWKSKARLIAVWPAEERENDRPGFFYLTLPTGSPVRTPSQAKEHFPALGVIPILTPAEHSERLLDVEYVKQNIAGRLSSRHFRNQLRLLESNDELKDFVSWARPWLGDLSFDTLGQHFSEDGYLVEAFFYEGGSRVPKEVAWAGDGVQVWLQLLYHIYRVREHDTIILDEPEVYLHPDLQRRLVRLLESTGRQIILATHSSEMVAESDGRLTTLIDRTRRNAIRPKTDADFELLSATLGTAFNLRLARALRSRVVVFVEGQDMSVLRRFAKTLGLTAIEGEIGLTVIPLQGYSNWGRIEPFTWLCGELLPQAVKTFVILDRDYRPEEARIEIMENLKTAGICGHVWERKELESYLLSPSVVARLSGVGETAVVNWFEEITKSMESDVFGRLLDEQVRRNVSPTKHLVDVTSAFKKSFDAEWKSPEYRLKVCPPKQVVAKVNGELGASHHRTVSMATLAQAHRAAEIPQEVKDLLTSIEAAAQFS